MKSITSGGYKHARADLVGVALMIALTAAAYFMQVQPLVEHNAAHASQITQLEAEQKKLPGTKRTMQTMRVQLDKVETTIAQTNLKLEPANQLNERLARLTEIANKNNLQLDEIEPGKPTAQGQFETIDIRLAGKGGYRDCARFLRSLHEQLPDTSAVSFDLTAAERGLSASLGTATNATSTATNSDKKTIAGGSFVFVLCWHTAAGEARAAK